MTTPGGVPNLPQGALTIDTLADKTQDMSTPAMRSRAAERFPNIFDSSTGGNALNDLTPIGIITQIFAGFNSVVANADPADVQGPEDLPGLLLNFIESLPVVGELVGLLEAILGTYTGDDPVLLEVQTIFAPIRAIVDAITAVSGGSSPTALSGFFNNIPLLPQLIALFPGATGGLTGLTGLGSIFGDLTGLLGNPTGLGSGTPGIGSLSSIPILGPVFGLFGGASNATQATNFFTNLLSFLSNPTLTGSPGSFNSATAATDFINNILNPTGLLATLSSITDAIFQAITGATRGGTNPLTDLTDVFTHFPALNVLGVGGPSTIAGSVTTGWDQLLSGYVGAIGSGATLADLFNIGQAVSSGSTLGKFSFDILGIRNDNQLNTGFLPTTQSNISLDRIALGSTTMSTFGITQSTAITAYHLISRASNFGVVSWQGSGVASITHAFVNIFKMDTTTGVNTLVHASPNIIGSLSGSMQQNVYSLVDGSGNPAPIHVEPGEVYGIEIAIRAAGAATHLIGGAASGLPDQTVFPRRYSSVRDSGTSAPPSTLTPSYGTNVPFIEFGVTASSIPLPHSPEVVQFSVAGSSSYPIPDWANFIDRVMLPGAGGGHQGGTWGIGGAGGDVGAWAWDTLARGVDFTDGMSLTTVVAAGGSAGVGGNGGNGAASTSSIIGGHILTTTGGVGATSFDVVGSAHSGKSPGNFAFPGGGPAWLIAGGAAQGTYGAKGNGPGGGGAGGNWVSFQPGGAGADGIILYRFRQS